MDGNFINVFRPNMTNPRPNGSIPFKKFTIPRAELGPRPPVQFRVVHPQAVPVQHPVALPAPQQNAPQNAPQQNAPQQNAPQNAPQQNAPQNGPQQNAPQQNAQPQNVPQQNAPQPLPALLPLPVPPQVILNPRTILQNANIQHTILNLLSHCHRVLYNPMVQAEIISVLSPPAQHMFANADITNLYKLIVKGGNTTVLLEERSYIGRPQNRRNYPLSFTNDLDVSLLINPIVSHADFTNVRNRLISHILQSIHFFLQQAEYRANVLADYAQAGIQVNMDAFNQIIYVDDNEHVVSENAETEGILHSDAYRHIPAGCPFMIGIHRDKIYYKPRIGANGNPVVGADGVQIRDKIKHDLSVIQIGTRSMPEHTLLEFAIPSKNFTNLVFEWSMTMNHIVFIDGIYRFLVMNPIGIYFDQKYAAAANTRPQKRANRTRRARQIMNRIVNPRVQNGTLRQNYNTKRIIHTAHKLLSGYPLEAND